MLALSPTAPETHEDFAEPASLSYRRIRPETVKTRLHLARRLLREALDAKLASARAEAFPFMGARCSRITGAALAGWRLRGSPRPETIRRFSRRGRRSIWPP